MGNCLHSSASKPQRAHANSGAFRKSPSSSLKIPSKSGSSNYGYVWIRRPITEGEIVPSTNLKAFSYNELKNGTNNFSPDSLLGKGRLGDVFKGWIDEITWTAAKPGSGMPVAVTKCIIERFPDHKEGHKEWLEEVSFLGQLHHPNLVKLIGYCFKGKNRLLVFEFLAEGSLEKHLFARGAQPLSWAIRMKVAIGAAQALSFLNDAKSQISYKDFKTSTILLDAEFNSKFSYFSWGMGGPTSDGYHVTTKITGTHGYAAPEYVATGHLTEKSNVYSFGLVLLELLCGRRAFDVTKNDIEQNLVMWATPYLGDKRKLYKIMDTKLGDEYPKEGAYTAFKVALQCLSIEPKHRPRISEVVTTLEQLASS